MNRSNENYFVLNVNPNYFLNPNTSYTRQPNIEFARLSRDCLRTYNKLIKVNIIKKKIGVPSVKPNVRRTLDLIGPRGQCLTV